jgi:hypothetical protein
MAAPSKPRTEIPAGKLDAESPWTEEVTVFIDDNTTHNDERIGIPTIPAARQANHRHRGLGEDGSDFIELTPQENLISKADLIYNTNWTYATTVGAGGIAFVDSSDPATGSKIVRSTGAAAFEKSTTRALISANLVKKIKSSSGLGRFTCSIHVKRLAAASGVVGGTLRFGIWDGSAFVTGAFVDIDFDDVGTEYTRFYFISNQIARPTALNLRAEWTANPSDWDTVSNGDDVGYFGGIMINNGPGLARWDISHRDGTGDDYEADTSNLAYWWDENITDQQETP